jgi:hypothetical protein
VSEFLQDIINLYSTFASAHPLIASATCLGLAGWLAWRTCAWWHSQGIVRVQAGVGGRATRANRNARNTVAEFRTRARNLYSFSFEEADGNWRAYILTQPGYGSRSDSAHDTHRLTDNNRRYVCWSTPLHTMREMVAVAQVWAEATDRYISTGSFSAS